MIIKEYRILVPLTLDEYVRGQLYSTAKVSRAETRKGEGVEVLVNEPTVHPQYGKGQYTKKIYHLGSRLPSFIRYILPAKAMLLEEEAWNCFPYCKTIIKSPMFGDSLTFTIETMHVQDKGEQDNVLGLAPEVLKKRKVDWIDITVQPESKNYKKEHDPTLWRSALAGRGPLQKDWHKTMQPVMCCYKTVTYEFKNRLLGGTVEKFMEKFERDLFYRFHRELVCSMDEWFNMTLEDIRAYEKQTAMALKSVVTHEQEIHTPEGDSMAAAAASTEEESAVQAALADESTLEQAAVVAAAELETS